MADENDTGDGYTDFLYGTSPAFLTADQLRDFLLELAKINSGLAGFLRQGGIPTADHFLGKIYPDADVAPDVEDNYATILGALRAYKEKTKPVDFRRQYKGCNVITSYASQAKSPNCALFEPC
jgi:hypothetical protein